MSPTRLPVGLRRIAIGILLAVSVMACKREEVRSFRGVTEVEVVQLTAPHSGNLASLSVQPGTRVAEGAQVFSVTEDQDAESRKQASDRLSRLRQQSNGAGASAKARESLEAELAEARWKLSQQSASAPVDGVVVETLFSKGDWVPAGAPVVAILPVDKIKVRFEVPHSVASHLEHGRSVTLLCERCEQPVEATIVYVSPFAEADEGDGPDTLRYKVEARPNAEQAAVLKPGLPVTIIL